MDSPARLSYSSRSSEGVALAADPVMQRIICSVGEISVRVETDRFSALASAIVGQQLSAAAAATIWRRFAALGPVDPEAVLRRDEAELRAVGLSGAKVRYMKDLAARVASGDLDMSALDAMDDDAVIAEVTRVKGVGRWTAEMFLVFSLARPDVLALDDAGLLRAAG